MSVFLERNHLFLRAPDGGVEDVRTMVAAGFDALFCNIGDYPPESWEFVRERAKAEDVPCGPWLRVAQGGTGAFDPERFEKLLAVADQWGSPLIVNAEGELKDTGSSLTGLINEECGDRDWALSMEPWPFATTDWLPISAPVLPQVFGPEWGAAADEVRAEWNRVGVACVVSSFGTYGGWTPSMYDRISPFGLYTADDVGNLFSNWSSLGVRNPCQYDPVPPTSSSEKIGSQHGIEAMADVFREQWPDKTGKPDPDDHSTWKAIDKWERAMKMLVERHDAEA